MNAWVTRRENTIKVNTVLMALEKPICAIELTCIPLRRLEKNAQKQLHV